MVEATSSRLTRIPNRYQVQFSAIHLHPVGEYAKHTKAKLLLIKFSVMQKLFFLQVLKMGPRVVARGRRIFYFII